MSQMAQMMAEGKERKGAMKGNLLGKSRRHGVRTPSTHDHEQKAKSSRDSLWEAAVTYMQSLQAPLLRLDAIDSFLRLSIYQDMTDPQYPDYGDPLVLRATLSMRKPRVLLLAVVWCVCVVSGVCVRVQSHT